MSGRHHHHHSPTPPGSAEGLRAVKLSVAGLGATAVAQVAIAAVSGSVALWADTVHNFSDALTALPLSVAFLLSRRPPTRRYPYGLGRAEDVAGLVIVAAIGASAALIAWQSLGRLTDPRDVDHVGWVAAAGVVGFVGNELVALYRIRVGRRIGSAALVADGLHARTDGLTSLAVVGAAVGTAAGWRLADPLVGLAVSAVVVWLLWVTARDIFRRILDGVDPATVGRMEAELEATPGVEAVDRVRARWVGHQLHADADVVLDTQLNVGRAHAVLEEAQHRLLHEIPHLAEAVLHANPDDPDDPHATTRHHHSHHPS